MDNILRSMIVRFAQLTLDDDHGISDAAMAQLWDLKDQADKVDPVLAEHLYELFIGVDSVDGRNFIPEGQ